MANSALPDRIRLGLVPPARSLATSIARVAAAATWRTLHPAARETYLETGAPEPLARVYYTAADGWSAPLRYLPPAPGGSGEPVVVAHALGVSPDAFRYGAGPTIAGELAAAGFSVYLLSHRGDSDAEAPDGDASFCFDDIVEHDLVAAIERVCEHSGFPAVHFLGHALGAQLGIALAARGTAPLATLVALSGAVRFDGSRSETRRASRVAAWLPAHWRLPMRALGPALAPWFDAANSEWARQSPASRVRGVLHHGMEDLPLPLLAQMSRWIDAGVLCDSTGLFDYLAATSSARCPLLLGAGVGDPVAPAARVLPLGDHWGGEWEVLEFPSGYSHYDPLLASDARRQVFAPLTEWLGDRRRLAWTPAFA